MISVLTDEQVNQLLGQVAKGIFPLRNYCMIYLMLVHGLRIKEVIDLRVKDVDMLNGWLTIRRSFKGMDDIHPLTVNGQRLLVAWLAKRRDCRDSTPEGPLFVTRWGYGWSRFGMIKLLNELSGQLPFSITSSRLYTTTQESLLNLPARESAVRSYLGRTENHLTIEEKQHLQRSFAFWHQGVEWVLEQTLRSQNGPKCLLVWQLLKKWQDLLTVKALKSVSYC